jgi:hypothetical protein
MGALSDVGGPRSPCVTEHDARSGGARGSTLVVDAPLDPPAAVRCLACRAVYVPKADGSSGCPLCGCVSWLSLEVGARGERGRRLAERRIGAVAMSVLGWSGMLGRKAD